MRNNIIVNQQLQETIRFLKVVGRKNKSKIWELAAEHLSRPRRRRVILDVSHLSRLSKPGAIILIPGKVLGGGSIKHPITVGAFQFSQTAKVKIESAGGKCLPVEDFVAKYPKGSSVQILR